MSEEALLLLLDKALQDLGSMKLTRYVILALPPSFSLILLFIFKWFDRQKAYLDSLESQLRGLVKAIELVAKHRSGVFFF
jgi:Vps5 C terminal like